MGTLNRTGLENSIYEAFDSMTDDSLPEESRKKAQATMKELSEKLASAISNFVKEGTVTTTIEGATSSGAVVTGKGTGKLS